LEWFSAENGRVILESADYELTISDPEWRLGPDENEDRTRQSAAGMAGFMGKLTDVMEQQETPSGLPKNQLAGIQLCR
jgi:hypothetical protein